MALTQAEVKSVIDAAAKVEGVPSALPMALKKLSGALSMCAGAVEQLSGPAPPLLGHLQVLSCQVVRDARAAIDRLAECNGDAKDAAAAGSAAAFVTRLTALTNTITVLVGGLNAVQVMCMQSEGGEVAVSPAVVTKLLTQHLSDAEVLAFWQKHFPTQLVASHATFVAAAQSLCALTASAQSALSTAVDHNKFGVVTCYEFAKFATPTLAQAMARIAVDPAEQAAKAAAAEAAAAAAAAAAQSEGAGANASAGTEAAVDDGVCNVVWCDPNACGALLAKSAGNQQLLNVWKTHGVVVRCFPTAGAGVEYLRAHPLLCFRSDFRVICNNAIYTPGEEGKILSKEEILNAKMSAAEDMVRHLQGQRGTAPTLVYCNFTLPHAEKIAKEYVFTRATRDIQEAKAFGLMQPLQWIEQQRKEQGLPPSLPFAPPKKPAAKPTPPTPPPKPPAQPPSIAATPTAHSAAGAAAGAAAAAAAGSIPALNASASASSNANGPPPAYSSAGASAAAAAGAGAGAAGASAAAAGSSPSAGSKAAAAGSGSGAGAGDGNDSKASKASKDSNEAKDSKDSKESKDAKDSNFPRASQMHLPDLKAQPLTAEEQKVLAPYKPFHPDTLGAYFGAVQSLPRPKWGSVLEELFVSLKSNPPLGVAIRQNWLKWLLPFITDSHQMQSKDQERARINVFTLFIATSLEQLFFQKPEEPPAGSTGLKGLMSAVVGGLIPAAPGGPAAAAGAGAGAAAANGIGGSKGEEISAVLQRVMDEVVAFAWEDHTCRLLRLIFESFCSLLLTAVPKHMAWRKDPEHHCWARLWRCVDVMVEFVFARPLTKKAVDMHYNTNGCADLKLVRNLVLLLQALEVDKPVGSEASAFTAAQKAANTELKTRGAEDLALWRAAEAYMDGVGRQCAALPKGVPVTSFIVSLAAQSNTLSDRLVKRKRFAKFFSRHNPLLHSMFGGAHLEIQMKRNAHALHGAATVIGDGHASGTAHVAVHAKDDELNDKGTDEIAKQCTPATELASGAFGTVYKIKFGGATWACKVVTITEENSRAVRAELRILRELRARYCVQFGGARVTPTRLIVLMEFCASALEKRMALGHEKPVTPAQALSWACQIASGLAELHARHIVHRDLKPGNVLLTRHEEVKLCDFGLSHFAESKQTQMQTMVANAKNNAGTPLFQAPETSDEDKSTGPPGDIYSFGITLHWMFSPKRLVPYQHLKPMQLLRVHSTEGAVLPIDPELTAAHPRVAAIITRCTAWDPAKRPNAEAVRKDLCALFEEYGVTDDNGN